MLYVWHILCRSQPSTDSQLVPTEQWTGGSREASLPLVPMHQTSGGIPPHPSAQQPRHGMEAEDVPVHSSREDLVAEPMHGDHSVSHKVPSRVKHRPTDCPGVSSSQEDLLEAVHTASEHAYASNSCSDSDNSMSWL